LHCAARQVANLPHVDNRGCAKVFFDCASRPDRGAVIDGTSAPERAAAAQGHDAVATIDFPPRHTPRSLPVGGSTASTASCPAPCRTGSLEQVVYPELDFTSAWTATAALGTQRSESLQSRRVARRNLLDQIPGDRVPSKVLPGGAADVLSCHSRRCAGSVAPRLQAAMWS